MKIEKAINVAFAYVYTVLAILAFFATITGHYHQIFACLASLILAIVFYSESKKL